MLKAAADVIMLDKENKEVRQRGWHPQDPGFATTLTLRVPIRGGQANRTHSEKEKSAGSISEAGKSLYRLTKARSRRP